MSYLGFGQKAVYGAVDIGALVPEGTYCKPKTRATSISEALGNCNSTHGGWGLDNPCGDYLRAAILNFAMDFDYFKAFHTDNPHGDHEHAGYPDFKYWPHQKSVTHQQMWWEWVKRAYEGGLRVMVALAVNSELLAEILNGNQPYDDVTVADLQIDETIAFVNNHRDFMEIAYSSADLRRIVGENKLAIVLGIEVDKLGNFGKPGVRTDAASVRAEIQRLYRKGVRYVFPVHLIDNSFGGAAVYNMLFTFANKRANGYYFIVTTSPDPNVTYNAALLNGFENVSILAVRGVLEGMGQAPAPCADFPRCFPPKVACCGSYQNVLNALAPGPELQLYSAVPPGHVNVMGLTPLGETAIKEMMKLGMIIDVDHMSERSMTRAIEIAEEPPGYPLVMGHNAVRGENSDERSAPAALLKRIADLGGMLGVGSADVTPYEFAYRYSLAWGVMSNVGIGIGTDADGLEKLPRHTHPAVGAVSDKFYGGFFRDSPIKTKQTTGARTWDYVLEGGVPHYGLMPEFLYDVKTDTPQGAEVYQMLMQSADYFAKMWEKCEASATSVPPSP